MNKPKLAVSRCLLGEKVRFDGGHKKFGFLISTLSNYFELVPFCPEVEIGLPIPRDSLRIVESDGEEKLINNKTGEDSTSKMLEYAEKKSVELVNQDIVGVIFTAKSPSCGLFRVKTYGEDRQPRKLSSGIFAKTFHKNFPLVPAEEDGRLNDSSLKENFIERIFARHDWLTNYEESAKFLYYFQTKYKYTLMAHSPQKQKDLGKLIADVTKDNIKEVIKEYENLFMEAMGEIATTKKHTNVLHHIMGYFKNDITSDEKQELVELIENYHNGLLPLIVPVTLLNHFVRKYKESYLEGQHYLNYHPMELMLRTNV